MNSKLLLHTCCAPCIIAIIDELKKEYDLTVFFYNPNIYPEDEYLKRKKHVIDVCTEWRVSMIDMDYEAGKWQKAVKGLEKEREGGMRCLACFNFRLLKTANHAVENDFEYFASSLSSGRNKKADVINFIGSFLAKEKGLKFLEENWKDGGRQDRARQMVKQRDIHRQNHCGCRYSLPSDD